jgi:putative flippase GtrA
MVGGIHSHSKMGLVSKYSFFALISIAVNLSTQFLSFRFYQGPYNLMAALVLGTGTGLITKYVLDKKYIFYWKAQSGVQDVSKFSLYSLMGVFTTAIFWGSEYGFDLLIQAQWAKYIGGFLGLTIGYFVKYQLDKRFVFSSS